MVEEGIQPREEGEETEQTQSLFDTTNPRYQRLLARFVDSMRALAGYYDEQKSKIESYTNDFEEILRLSLIDTNKSLRAVSREVLTKMQALDDDAQLQGLHAQPPDWIPADAPQNRPGPERYEFTQNEEKFRTFPLVVIQETRNHGTILRRAYDSHLDVRTFVEKAVDTSVGHEARFRAGSSVKLDEFPESLKEARRRRRSVPADAAVDSTADSTADSQDEPRQVRPRIV